jgi:hypothetical protein
MQRFYRVHADNLREMIEATYGFLGGPSVRFDCCLAHRGDESIV